MSSLESSIAVSAAPATVEGVSANGEQPTVVSLAPSAGGRTSGKAWKVQKTATVRSHIQEGVKTKKWDDRMQKVQKEKAIKKLQAELKEEKETERKRRRDITIERRKAAEERQRLEEDKAKMGARRAARLRRKEGRTKKINH